jgi:acetyl-CoA acyltransferase 1
VSSQCPPRPCPAPSSNYAANRSPTNNSTAKNADDIVITLAIRTPLTKARKGGFKDSSVEFLAYAILKEVKERSNLDPALVEDICMGNVRNAVPSLTILQLQPLG